MKSSNAAQFPKLENMNACDQNILGRLREMPWFFKLSISTHSMPVVNTEIPHRNHYCDNQKHLQTIDKLGSHVALVENRLYNKAWSLYTRKHQLCWSALLHWREYPQPPLRVLLRYPQGIRKSSSIETVNIHVFGRMSTKEFQVLKKLTGR